MKTYSYILRLILIYMISGVLMAPYCRVHHYNPDYHILPGYTHVDKKKGSFQEKSSLPQEVLQKKAALKSSVTQPETRLVAFSIPCEPFSLTVIKKIQLIL